MTLSNSIGVITLFLLGLAVTFFHSRFPAWLHEGSNTNPAVVLQSEIDCDPALKTCIAHNEEINLGLSLQGPVRALTAFPVMVQFNATTTETPVHHLAITFSMVGMSMGLNRFKLEQLDPQTWTGQAILPVCGSGRTDWRITVEVDGGYQYSADFFTIVTR